MPIFPIISAILAPAALAELVSARYSLQATPTCRLLKAGINHTYLVENEHEKYVWRVYSYQWRSEAEILEELRLILTLQQHDIEVSYPVADRHGNYLQSIQAPEGIRFGVLFTYALGEKMLHFSPETHRAVGEIMARIHQQTQNLYLDRVTYSPQVLLVESFVELSQFLPADTEEWNYMSALQKYLLKKIETVDEIAIRQGAVHLDIWFDNLNVNTDGTITIFDFDFCGNGWLCLDVAYYFLQTYALDPNSTTYHAKINDFLLGYELLLPLSAEEKRLVPLLGLCLHFFYLGVQCHRFDNYSSVFLNEVYLKRYVTTRVKQYAQFHQIVPE
ncbi:MAG: phosphotransferase [Spirosomataceae bacterium]